MHISRTLDFLALILWLLDHSPLTLFEVFPEISPIQISVAQQGSTTGTSKLH